MLAAEPPHVPVQHTLLLELVAAHGTHVWRASLVNGRVKPQLAGTPEARVTHLARNAAGARARGEVVVEAALRCELLRAMRTAEGLRVIEVWRLHHRSGNNANGYRYSTQFTSRVNVARSEIDGFGT